MTAPSTQIDTQSPGAKMNAPFFFPFHLHSPQEACWSSHASFSPMSSDLGLPALLTETLQVSSTQALLLHTAARQSRLAPPPSSLLLRASHSIWDKHKLLSMVQHLPSSSWASQLHFETLLVFWSHSSLLFP